MLNVAYEMFSNDIKGFLIEDRTMIGSRFATQSVPARFADALNTSALDWVHGNFHVR
jgi:hypothetical protein